MGEIFYLKELAQDCAEDGIYEFFFLWPAAHHHRRHRVPDQSAGDQIRRRIRSSMQFAESTASQCPQLQQPDEDPRKSHSGYDHSGHFGRSAMVGVRGRKTRRAYSSWDFSPQVQPYRYSALPPDEKRA